MNKYFYYKKAIDNKEVVSDFKPPSEGGVATEARVAIINKVLSARPMKEVFAPAKVNTTLGLRLMGELNRGVELSKNQILEPPQFDFNEIDRVTQLEPMVMRAFYTIVSLVINNNGFRFEGENPRSVAWVVKRLDELTFSVGGTGSIQKMMRSIVENVVKKSNALIWLRRERDGAQYKYPGGKRRTPRAIEIIDPSMINVVRNTNSGRIEGYHLSTESDSRKIMRSDIHHIRYQQVTQDHWFGCPMILPVLNDIIALRHMEEMVHMAMGKATFPIYHIAIGDEKGEIRPQIHGTRGTDNEVNTAKAEWEGMAPEGAIFTPGYYRIQVVQPKSVADFDPYLKWYRERIVMGLMADGPTMGFGETANRDTSNTMTQNLINKVKDIQCHISDQINTGLIRELLLEGNFRPIGTDAVHLVWDEVDLEAMMNKNNHTLALFQGSLLTFDEARKQMGLDPMTESDINTKTYQPHLAKFQAQVKAAGQQNAVANRNRPTNQSGTRSAAASRRTRKDSITAFNRLKTLSIALGEEFYEDPRYNASIRALKDAILRDMRRELPGVPLKKLEKYANDKVDSMRADIKDRVEGGELRIGLLFDIGKSKINRALDKAEQEFLDDSP